MFVLLDLRLTDTSIGATLLSITSTWVKHSYMLRMHLLNILFIHEYIVYNIYYILYYIIYYGGIIYYIFIIYNIYYGGIIYYIYKLYIKYDIFYSLYIMLDIIYILHCMEIIQSMLYNT